MKQQNFLFVDLVSSIFLLVILIGNFMGLLYLTDGNLVISMLGSMFLVICYFFVVQSIIQKSSIGELAEPHPANFSVGFLFVGNLLVLRKRIHRKIRSLNTLIFSGIVEED